MTNAGYATFNFDRIGIGESDHPAAALITIQANAYVVHEIVGALKAGSIEGHAFKKVLLVGHSVGSAISVSEAGTYADVDGVLLTGFLHFVDPAVLPRLSLDIYPAVRDPEFSNSGLPVGYVTTKPDTRGRLFYYLPNADQQVIATDEATKETITDSEFSTFFTISSSPLSQRIHVPILVAVGQYDNLFCLGTFSCTNKESVRNYETVYYSPQAQLQLVVIPQAGHDLNLQLNAPTDWFPQALQWIQSIIAP
jgi:pimeloyl-ACP methyl ester carboxylesterase